MAMRKQAEICAYSPHPENDLLQMADAVAAFVSNPYAQGQVAFDVRWPDNDSCWVGGDHGAC
jgi:hypothetical protein